MVPFVIKRPLLSIQCNWNEVLRERDGTAWVTCKELGNNSKCGSLKNAGNVCNATNIEATEGFKIASISQNSVTVTHEDPNCRCEFTAPDKCFSRIHQKNVIGLNVTSNGLGVSACSDNKLRVWDSSNGDIRRNLEGHIWDVYTCRFFPSGIVVLSGGADMQLKIWSAETGQCAATLIGHGAAIMDTAIVERGRNVISVSKDGTACLWDCGKSACLCVLAENSGAINCCAVSSVDIDVGSPDVPPSEREIGTSGKLLLLGCENGTFSGVSVPCRKSIFNYSCSDAVNTCCFLSHHQALCGTQDGQIYRFDLRNTSEPLTVWEESASPVLSSLPMKNGFFVGRADGTCEFFSLNDDQTIQLTGSDFDPIYCISTDGTHIYTACRDGLIRKYKVTTSMENR